jgi:hypothetical protein
MWTDPVTDRAMTDLLNRTAKGFLNVADWVRINANTEAVQALVDTLLALDVDLTTLTTPSITTHPTATEINQLIENIELLREAACLPAAAGVLPLKRDYQGGAGAIAPNYEAVNAWERNLSLLYALLVTASDYFVYCGVANAGQSRFWQNRFR